MSHMYSSYSAQKWNYWVVFINNRDLTNPGDRHHVCLYTAMLLCLCSNLYFMPVGPTVVVLQLLSRGRRFQLHTNAACVVCKPIADVGKTCILKLSPPSPVGNKCSNLYLIIKELKLPSLWGTTQGLLGHWCKALKRHLFPPWDAWMFQDVVLIMGRTDRPSEERPAKIPHRVEVHALWWLIHAWKWSLVLPEILALSLSFEFVTFHAETENYIYIKKIHCVKSSPDGDKTKNTA